MPEKFIKKPHYLEHTDALKDNIMLGFTTREDGESDYPKNAFSIHTSFSISEIFSVKISAVS